jgi:hypothetical protein
MSLEPEHSVQRAWVGGSPGGADGGQQPGGAADASAAQLFRAEDSDIHQNLSAIP